ncbi:MAG: T9SS type A sorting domain-containing protein, partial [Hymenobacteraceae bacterium]|nr:T9SS type A sorting domain-containing protein [Hymenobacteraceae bacterium]MDX5394595.1 T9SS type A sorting domain-containing protein [Hymenobacteraceae bacterium]MDX5510623.1 T9SS type A sorting domain-containing protein [Hymenobacteraceae bacterium]
LYQFIDKEENKTGVRYYRLKQVDLDGTASYYGVRAVQFDVMTVEVYPNPFNNVFSVNVTSARAAKLRVEVRDMSGRVVAGQEYDVQAGTVTKQVEVGSNLASGVYMLQVDMDGQVERIRMVKH